MKTRLLFFIAMMLMVVIAMIFSGCAVQKSLYNYNNSLANVNNAIAEGKIEATPEVVNLMAVQTPEVSGNHQSKKVNVNFYVNQHEVVGGSGQAKTRSQTAQQRIQRESEAEMNAAGAK